MSAILNSSTLANQVDRFAELTLQLKAFDDAVKERDTLRKQLAEFCDSVSSDDVRLTGNRYFVAFTKAPLMRSVSNIAGFFNAVGLERFLSVVKVNTSDADRLLTETQKTALLEATPGSRRLKDVGELPNPVSAFYLSLAGALQPGHSPKPLG